MRISIIIPVYKAERYIARCLQSVASQTWQGEVECLLVDDCGGDNSMEIARKFKESYRGQVEFIFLSHDTNRGPSAARNTGIRQATGEFLFFLDSDDELTPDCLARLVAVWEQHPDVDFVQGNIVVTDEMWRYLDITNFKFPDYTTDRNWIEEHMLTDIPDTVWNKLCNRRWFIDNGLWFVEGIVHEDHQWRLAHAKKVSAIAFCTVPTYVYYRTPDSITNSPVKDESVFSRLSIIEAYIPTISRPHRYIDVLRRLHKVWLDKGGVTDVETFDIRYREVIDGAIRSPKVPVAAKIGFYSLLHCNSLFNFTASYLWRPVNTLIRFIKRGWGKRQR